MKKLAVILLMVGIVSLAQTARTAEFTVSSPQLPANGRMAEAQVYNSFGCTGKNISPILMWQNAPEKTRSFAVTVYDPDAPTGSGWWHWLIFNIPTKVNMLPENAGNKEAGLAPAGSTQSRTDYGTPGYGGACPPAGDQPHRYIFTVFALDVDTLPLPENASAAMVGFNLNQHAIAKAQMSAFSGMISFELEGGIPAGRTLLNSVRLCQLAESLGAVETMITHPATMTHAEVPAAERHARGLTDGLCRLSVGIEDVSDILADLEAALAEV